MKICAKRRASILSTCFLIPLIASCAYLLPDVNVGHYEITTPTANQPEFEKEANAFAKTLAEQLDWNYVVVQEIPGESVSGHFVPKTRDFSPRANINFEWERGQGTFGIGWTGVPPSTPDFQKLRGMVEGILNKNSAYKWKFYFQQKEAIPY